MAGGAVAFNREDYNSLDADALVAELQRVGMAD